MQGFLTKYMKQLDTEMEKRKIDFKDDNITGPIKKSMNIIYMIFYWKKVFILDNYIFNCNLEVLSLKQGSITNQKRNKYEANKRNFISK